MNHGPEPPNEWDSAAYDGSHSFVYEYGEDLLDLLGPEADERILDLGCGTGHLTKQIAARAGEVVGLDHAPDMVETARETYPELSFVQADAREFTVDEPFDAVFSNAALHWIDDQEAVASAVSDALCPGGRFVAELGGSGNVRAIVDALREALARRGYDVDSPWYFPTVGEYTSVLEANGFEVQYATLFDRPTDLDGGEDGLATWLEMFGDSFFTSLSDSERTAVVSEVEARLSGEHFVDGTWVVPYRRLRVAARRR